MKIIKAFSENGGLWGLYSRLSLSKKSALWYLAATVTQNGVLFLTTPLYTRILTDAEYGVFSVSQTWQSIVSILSVLALERCVTVGFMKFESDRAGFLSALQTLMTITVALSALLVPLFPDAFRRMMALSLPVIGSLFVTSLMNNTFSVWSWRQRYLYHYRTLTAFTVISTLIIQCAGILGTLFLPMKNKGEAMILSFAAARLILYGLLYWDILWKGRVFVRLTYWKFALRYSIAVIPHALSQIVLHSSDRIMIDRICGREEAAYYGIAYTAASVLTLVLSSVSFAFQPAFFKALKEKNYEGICKITDSILIFALVLSLLASLAAPWIFPILAPPSYRPALWVFPPVAVSSFFYSMYLCFANFESYYERPHYLSIATMTGASVNIALNYLFIPRFGFAAAGYTTLVCYIIFTLMHYFFMRKICGEMIENWNGFDIRRLLLLSLLALAGTGAMLWIYTL